MTINKQKHIQFINDCGCIVDEDELRKAISDKTREAIVRFNHSRKGCRMRRKRIELSSAIQELENLLIFSHFDSDESEATISNDGEVFLEYHGKEMSKDAIIETMREVGYITPYDLKD